MEGPFLLAQILTVGFFLIFCVLTPILTVIALINLRKHELSATAKGVWALVVMVPILGPLAFWITNPKELSHV